MIEFKCSPLWSASEYDSLLEKMKVRQTIKITWYWRPYHETALRAFTFCQENNIAEQLAFKWLNELSGPGIPNDLSPLFSKDLTDEYGCLKTLHPSLMERTLRHLFQKKNQGPSAMILPTLAEFQRDLQSQNLSFEPLIEGVKGFDEMSNWLAKRETVYKNFQKQKAWEKFMLFESLQGIRFFSSEITFSPIYT